MKTSQVPAPSRRRVVGGIADRLFKASRAEFSLRGYHGARVQGIARAAGCNVALLYRHWASKEALYLEVLGAVWMGAAKDIAAFMERGASGVPGVIAAYLDALMADQEGAQILAREYLDGAPFLSQLFDAEPELTDPVVRAVKAFDVAPDRGEPLRRELDPALAALIIGGLAALIGAAQRASQPFLGRLDRPVPTPERWRNQAYDLLLHGAIRSAPPRP
jgi:TetR/AcrR family transcriptional regulator